MRYGILKLIAFYQKVLSPLWGPRCRFYPSCSAYAKQSYETFGFFKATGKALGRLFRCHPWNPGGFDPVEKNSY